MQHGEQRILIATPTYNGLVDARFTTSLIDTFRRVPPEWLLDIRILCGDAFISRARDALLAFAVEREADLIVWIDADTYWNAEDFIALIESPADYVGGLQLMKTFPYKVPVRPVDGARPDNETHLLEVRGIGFGFTKMTSKCFKALYEAASEYTSQGSRLREVFPVRPNSEGELVGEDFVAGETYRALGEHLYANVAIKVGHMSYSTAYDLKSLEDPEWFFEAPATPEIATPEKLVRSILPNMPPVADGMQLTARGMEKTQ